MLFRQNNIVCSLVLMIFAINILELSSHIHSEHSPQFRMLCVQFLNFFFKAFTGVLSHSYATVWPV